MFMFQRLKDTVKRAANENSGEMVERERDNFRFNPFVTKPFLGRVKVIFPSGGETLPRKVLRQNLKRTCPKQKKKVRSGTCFFFFDVGFGQFPTPFWNFFFPHNSTHNTLVAGRHTTTTQDTYLHNTDAHSRHTAQQDTQHTHTLTQDTHNIHTH